MEYRFSSRAQSTYVTSPAQVHVARLKLVTSQMRVPLKLVTSRERERDREMEREKERERE